MRNLLVAGAAFGFLAVALGAFGAHALREHLGPDRLAVYQTGIQYQMYHALALLLLAVLSERHPGVRLSGLLFSLGILLFSGSLYALSITERNLFGVVTPFGGLCFLAGWLNLMVAATRQKW